MVGWVQNLSFLRLPSVDFPSRRAETNENKNEPRRFGYVQIIRYRCIDVFILLIYIRYLLSGYFYFQGILGTTAEIAYGSFLFAFGF